jgi:hypothetical protein
MAAAKPEVVIVIVVEQISAKFQMIFIYIVGHPNQPTIAHPRTTFTDTGNPRWRLSKPEVVIYAVICNCGELPIPGKFDFIATVSGVPENMGAAFGNSLLAHPRRHILQLPVC